MTPRLTPTNEPVRAGSRLALLRLCHLVSPALPVGAYAYSQGLEQAVARGWVTDETSAFEWLAGLARCNVGTLDLPWLARLHAAWSRDDAEAVQYANAQLMAARDCAELRAEERHLGQALQRVLVELGVDGAERWKTPLGAPPASSLAAPTFAALFALATVRWGIEAGDALAGYLWTWTENQVLAAIKLVPLGQSAGQRLLQRLTHAIPDIVERALTLPDAAIGVGAWSQTLASAWHEVQYSRLFRS